jgi:TPR repeat protein
MAKAVLVCNECGKELNAGDKFCAHCGTRVESGGTPPVQNVQHAPASVHCEVCGHENVHSGPYCEACGVKLPGRAEQRRAGSSTEKASSAKTSRPTAKQPSSFQFAARHYVTGAIVLALVGTFAYLELRRDHSVAHEHQTVMPPAQAPSTPPSKEILDAIARLEKTVTDNPNDIGSKLLLANALHDGAMHDGSLLPRAIEAYKSYLKDKPGDPNARVDLGICYFEFAKTDSVHAGRFFSMAISEMETAVKGAPTHQPAAFNLGIVHLYAGNLKESNKWFQRAVELNPDSDLGRRAKTILEQHHQAG